MSTSALLWDDIYIRSQNLYPYDFVVSSLFKYRLANNVSFADMTILEVGCGSGNNLWFAAREGCKVYGFDFSKVAIKFAKRLFHEHNLPGNFQICTFSPLSYSSNFFDFVIDRAALTHVGFSQASSAIDEIYRVLKPGGMFLFNPYSSMSTSALFGATILDSGLREVTKGTLNGVGPICFYDSFLIKDICSNFDIVSLSHFHETFMTPALPKCIHAEWRALLSHPFT